MNEKTAVKKSEWLLWVGIAALLLAAMVVTYKVQLPSAIYALVWVLWLVATLGLGFFTTYGKKIFSFGTEAHIELQKVAWPTRQETIQTTLIVILVVAITGFVLWGLDSGMMWIIGKITNLG